LLLVINVLALNAWTWKEQASRQTQKDQLTQILKTAFPDIQVVVDPMVQMRRALVALQQKTATPNNGDFEHLLSAWALLSANNPGLDLQQVQTLRFQANELTVLWKGTNPSVSNPGLQLPLELKDQGYEVDSDGKQTHLRWSMKP
jgi:type II secretory pathway component PulL